MFALLVAVVVVVLFTVGVVHLMATSSLQRSRNTVLPRATRVALARQAARLEPWRVGASSQLALLEGATLYERGDLDEAKRVLGEARLKDLTNKDLESLLRKVNRDIIVRDSRKAHQQHGHEGPGGTLAPEDVER
jgi:hypothetical protein